MFKVPEQFRIYPPHLPSSKGDLFGCFRVQSPDPMRGHKTYLQIIASPGDESIGIFWEHVSVHATKMIGPRQAKNLTPTWAEMCYVKSLFWDAEDCVVQYHPPESQYVNQHQHCLHLWRPTQIEIPQPPLIAV